MSPLASALCALGGIAIIVVLGLIVLHAALQVTP